LLAVAEGDTNRQSPDKPWRISRKSGVQSGEPGPDGSTCLKSSEPLTSGEYGLVAIVRGQPNVFEVFDFGVD
jgi:hypothetical protein